MLVNMALFDQPTRRKTNKKNNQSEGNKGCINKKKYGLGEGLGVSYPKDALHRSSKKGIDFGFNSASDGLVNMCDGLTNTISGYDINIWLLWTYMAHIPEDVICSVVASVLCDCVIARSMNQRGVNPVVVRVSHDVSKQVEDGIVSSTGAGSNARDIAFEVQRELGRFCPIAG